MLKFYGQPAAPAVTASANTNPGGEVATVDVLVARSDIPIGTVLNNSMVDKQPWPKHLVVNDFIVSGAPDSNVEGMVTRSEFHTREPLMISRLAKPNDVSFLAAGLPKGMRAITVATDAITGVAGYIFPGDRVDIVFTHNVPQEAPEQMTGVKRNDATSSQKPTTSEVLLPNLRVLAVNLRKTEVRNPQQPQQSQQQQTVEAPTNITLEMAQDDVKKIRLAEKNGTLSLALRSLQDEGDVSVGVPITLLNLSRAEGLPTAEALRALKWVMPAPGAASGARPGEGTADEVIIIRGVKAEEGIHSHGSPAATAAAEGWPQAGAAAR
ncbi:MAG: Flp pilus assembly protein CpaB [Alphaproteobacteria bacterium]|nr:Flp pilus assembly protein CpaB [Alphaproteobacteria bacterium]